MLCFVGYRKPQNTGNLGLTTENVGEAASFGCRVVSGLWNLPYSGGSKTSASEIDIDHIIPLKWAHGHGADKWSAAKKRTFANDPDNLLATSSSANRSKGAKGPDEWMPAINKCSYAQRWEGLIEKYGLVTTTGEMAAIARVC